MDCGFEDEGWTRERAIFGRQMMVIRDNLDVPFLSSRNFNFAMFGDLHAVPSYS